MRIEKEIAHKKSRYESDLRDGLNVASKCPSWSKVVAFKEAECNCLVLDTVDYSIDLTGVSKTLPTILEGCIGVNKNEPFEK